MPSMVQRTPPRDPSEQDQKRSRSTAYGTLMTGKRSRRASAENRRNIFHLIQYVLNPAAAKYVNKANKKKVAACVITFVFLCLH